MSPSRGVRGSALFVTILVAVLSGNPAAAQWLYQDASQSLDGSLDGLTRNPRLLGMGRLSLVLDDVHNRIGFWDLGGNPVGVIDADTASTVEFSTTTRSAATYSNLIGASPAAERQIMGAREVVSFCEAWRRSENGTYGLLADIATIRIDHPYSSDIEQRSSFSRPNGMAIIAGRVPVIKTDRLSYAIRAMATSESNTDQYRLFVRNAAGDFIDQDGTDVGPPDFFVPEDSNVSKVGVGFALGMRVTRALRVAIGTDYANQHIIAKNTGFRHESETRDDRPYRNGQVTVGGVLGRSLEWGVDARGWNTSSDQTWVFSISAGAAAIPLNGRGALLRRAEEGSALRARLRWHNDRFEWGGGLSTGYRKVEIDPPDPGDETSLNHFLNVVYNRAGADSIALPDSVVHNTTEDRAWDAGGGLAWHPGERATIGVEGHYFRSERGQDLGGKGPRRLGWDVRSGIEYRLHEPLWLRGGYVIRREDLDDFTERNEFVIHTATTGVGYRPPGVSWGVDAAYAFEWVRADYAGPDDPGGTRQRLLATLRWLF